MSIAVLVDWHEAATAHLQWCLKSSRALAVRVEREVDFGKGSFVAYVPSPQKVENFNWAGDGSVAEARAAMADVCNEFLKTDGHIVAFEHHLWDLSDVKGWMKSPVAITDNSFVQLAFPGITTSHLDEVIKNWSYLPIYNAFLSDIGSSAASALAAGPERTKLDSGPIVSGLRGVLSGAYDGEGAIVWWRAGNLGSR
jgi:hypothetical protein